MKCNLAAGVYFAELYYSLSFHAAATNRHRTIHHVVDGIGLDLLHSAETTDTDTT